MQEPIIVACNFTVTLVHHVTFRIFLSYLAIGADCCCIRNQLASGSSVELEARSFDEQTRAGAAAAARSVVCQRVSGTGMAPRPSSVTSQLAVHTRVRPRRSSAVRRQ